MSDDYVIAIPIYEQVDLLDVAAPKEVFTWMRDFWSAQRVHVDLVAETDGPLDTRDGTTLVPNKTFDQVTDVDLLWVPGGEPAALVPLMKNDVFRSFLIDRSARAQYVTSVCEGALLAADAGLFDGYEITTHWAFIPCLGVYPKVRVAPGHPRFVHDRNRVTGGGISSGLDEALYLVKIICGSEIAKRVQRVIQYFPEPPINGEIPTASGCPVPGWPP